MKNSMSSSLLLLVSIVALSSGCSSENKPAPEPVPSPDAHVTTHLIITADDSNVDDIQVVSVWMIGNLRCAPINYSGGYINAKQINVNESVKKVGDGYVASVLMDRYMQDNCKWIWGGSQVNFMRKGKIYSTFLISPKTNNDNIYHLQCIPSGRFLGDCYRKGTLTVQDERFPNKFNAAVEVRP
jgi:hypothetical protein